MRRCTVALVPMLACAQVHVLTSNYDNARTNANLAETILTTSNVSQERFGKLGVWPVDGHVYAQPLHVSGIAVAGATRDVVYVATMHNNVYAFDAGSPANTEPLWQANLGVPVPSDVIRFRDIRPDIGILSTPVIDPSRNMIYLVTSTLEDDKPVFRLHARDLSDGHDTMNGSMIIEASVSGEGDASENGRISLDPYQHIQRPGLLLANDTIYVAFGSRTDVIPYHGWIFAYDAGNIRRRLAVFNSTPQGTSGGIWQAGRGLAADSEGNIYAATGNGDYDGIINFGESFIRLSPKLSVMDWFTPADWRELSDVDYDLGSLGPVLVPGTDFLIGGDKANNMYLVDRRNMGHLASKDAAGPQVFQPITFGGIFNIALWNREDGPLAYLVESGNFTASFRLSNGRFESQAASTTPVTSDWPFQGMAVSANGGIAGSGILWLSAGDHNTEGFPGILYAFDALDLTRVLWSSDVTADRDRPGAFAKFVAPTVANGRVYLPTLSNQVVVYGLLDASPAAPVTRRPGPSGGAAPSRGGSLEPQHAKIKP